jgi:hypothetical protein
MNSDKTNKLNGIVVRRGKMSIKLRKGMSRGKIWIEREDGEGGDFSQEELYKTLEEFYNERF